MPILVVLVLQKKGRVTIDACLHASLQVQEMVLQFQGNSQRRQMGDADQYPTLQTTDGASLGLW